MKILIDGFNLIYKFPDLEEMMSDSRLSEAENGLLEKLQKYQACTHDKITVVMDGRKEPGVNIEFEERGALRVYYSLDEIADDVIKRMTKNDKNPKMLTVVSSDKKVLFYVNRFGVKKVQSEIFAEKVQNVLSVRTNLSLAEKPNISEINSKEIEFWLKEFKKK